MINNASIWSAGQTGYITIQMFPENSDKKLDEKRRWTLAEMAASESLFSYQQIDVLCDMADYLCLN